MNEGFEININSPVFVIMLDQLNTEIRRVLEKVHDKEFSAGEISLKLNIELLSDVEYFPTEDGEEEERYTFTKPYFEHKITTNLKQQYKREGIYLSNEDELVVEEDRFMIVPLKHAQASIFD